MATFTFFSHRRCWSSPRWAAITRDAMRWRSVRRSRSIRAPSPSVVFARWRQCALRVCWRCCTVTRGAEADQGEPRQRAAPWGDGACAEAGRLVHTPGRASAQREDGAHCWEQGGLHTRPAAPLPPARTYAYLVSVPSQWLNRGSTDAASVRFSLAVCWGGDQRWNKEAYIRAVQQRCHQHVRTPTHAHSRFVTVFKRSCQVVNNLTLQGTSAVLGSHDSWDTVLVSIKTKIAQDSQCSVCQPLFNQPTVYNPWPLTSSPDHFSPGRAAVYYDDLVCLSANISLTCGKPYSH